MKKMFISIGFLICAIEPVKAQGVCGPHAQIVSDLESIYGETQQSIGLTANGAVIEVFASEAGTWTILITDVSGQTCLAAAGEAWQEIASGDPA